MTKSLIILSTGALTSVGLSAAQTCAAIRANISGFGEAEFLCQSSPYLESITVSQGPFSSSPAAENGFLRLLGMATHALGECIRSIDIDPARTALLLGVRESFRKNPNVDGRIDELIYAIQSNLGVRFHHDSMLVPQGRAAAFRGFLMARRLLTADNIEACIVGGVDSYLNEFDLSRFDEAYRLLNPPVSRGFIPGEGATFVAVTNRMVRTSRNPSVRILGIGVAHEDAKVTVLSDGHPTGKGLQRALEAAIHDANMPESKISFRVSDLNGERYYGIDSILAMSRFYKTRREHLGIWHSADCVGDIGAALGPLSIIIASVGITKGYAPGSIAMCEASSDEGLRAGCLIGVG